jgi:hypothetical protein
LELMKMEVPKFRKPIKFDYKIYGSKKMINEF